VSTKIAGNGKGRPQLYLRLHTLTSEGPLKLWEATNQREDEGRCSVWVGFVALLEATNNKRPCRTALLEKQQIEERPKCRREEIPLHDGPLLIGGLRSGSGGVDVLFGMLPDTCDFHFYPCELIATADASTLQPCRQDG